MTSATTCEGLGERLQRFLSAHWNAPVRVQKLARIPGGASRETYRFDAEADGKMHGLILRRDPLGSLIDTDRRLEFLALKSFQGIVPVPEPVVLERDGAALERPFFIMRRIDGGTAARPFELAPYGVHAGAVGEALFANLGRIARCDPRRLQLAESLTLPEPDACWRAALDHWEAIMLRDERHPQPIVRAALRRLRRNPPAPAAKIAVVHGDYRSGNVLHDGDGRLLGILDWEMVHLGDPLEDLAWCCDPLWSHFDNDRVAGTIPETQAIAIWERESGLTVDRATFRWWKLFSAVKGQAIWTTAAKAFLADKSNLALGFSGLYPARRHDVIIAERLAHLVEAGWT